MDAQEHFLAQFAGVVRVPHDIVHDAPAQALIGAHQLFEGAATAGQHGLDQFAVGVRGSPGGGGGGEHPHRDTPTGRTVASGESATGRPRAVSPSTIHPTRYPP